jgi:hypothetical protein
LREVMSPDQVRHLYFFVRQEVGIKICYVFLCKPARAKDTP